MQINISHFGVENDLYQECLKIRYEVLRKPLGMQILPEDREKDQDSTHMLLQVDGEPAGTVSLHNERLRQMAVLDKFQGQGIGAKLVSYLEQLARSQGLAEIMLDARFNAIPFYERLGYECHSEIYDKIGLKHRDMKKNLR
jgi:GNAT superfamily N-acetyltransferase